MFKVGDKFRVTNGIDLLHDHSISADQAGTIQTVQRIDSHGVLAHETGYHFYFNQITNLELQRKVTFMEL